MPFPSCRGVCNEKSAHGLPAVEFLQQRVELSLAEVLPPSVPQQDHSICAKDIQSVASLLNGCVEVRHRQEAKEPKTLWVLGYNFCCILIHLPCK